MVSPYDLERIEIGSGEFAETPAFDELSVAGEFLKHACAGEDTGPDGIG